MIGALSLSSIKGSRSNETKQKAKKLVWGHVIITHVSHQLCKLSDGHFVVWVANIENVTISPSWIFLQQEQIAQRIFRSTMPSNKQQSFLQKNKKIKWVLASRIL